VTILRAAAAGGVAVALPLTAVPFARTEVAKAASEPVRGLDISAYQHAGTPINWTLLARQGVRFIGFTAQAHALTGKWPIIYTTAAWWRECTGSTGRFRHDPLWLAAFGGTRPTVPSPWPYWTFWQYNNAGFLPGIGRTDLDYYQPGGGLPDLRPPKPKTASHRKKPAKTTRHPKPKQPKRHGSASPRSPGKSDERGGARDRDPGHGRLRA